MECSIEYLPYKQTNSFSSLATAYVEGRENLRSFYNYKPDLNGLLEALENRKEFPGNREVLVAQMKLQYAGKSLPEKLEANLKNLLNENCFTITTAHQPNIFTGHLYFIYKILHAIKLAAELKALKPTFDFVPVFYMGSEDADLEELGTITVNGKKYSWQTDQTGAVGRMYIDKHFLKLIEGLKGQLMVETFGAEIMAKLSEAYQLGKTIEQASFDFVHTLFGDYGLLILLPDNPVLKRLFQPIVEKEIFEQFSYEALQQTLSVFPEEYKIQASGRAINFFYLIENRRERIIKKDSEYWVENMDLRFDADAMRQEIEKYPERFSANVILRPVFQELLLPNIAFIGGGGELAYWLELKKVFEQSNIPYPVLILRNSFAIISKKTSENIRKLGLETVDLFEDPQMLLSKIVKRDSKKKLSLTEEKFALMKIYNQVRNTAIEVDKTLERHIWSLQSSAVNKLSQLEKKMMRASKKEFSQQKNRIGKIRAQLFPGEKLQERVENILGIYSKYGPEIMEQIYASSLGTEQKFTVLRMDSANLKDI